MFDDRIRPEGTAMKAICDHLQNRIGIFVTKYQKNTGTLPNCFYPRKAL